MQFEPTVTNGLLALIGAGIAWHIRRQSRVEEKVDSTKRKVIEVKDQLRSEISDLVSDKTCQERTRACHQLFRKGYLTPTANLLEEIRQGIKEDREQFWRAIHGHSHTGLPDGSKVIRDP
jgi:hypothetical protein